MNPPDDLPPPAEDPHEALETLIEEEALLIQEELLAFAETVVRLHQEGTEQLSKKFRIVGIDLEVGNIAQIIVNVADRMARYNQNYRIFPMDLDLTKFLTFAAADLKDRFLAEFNATPLFYRYVGLLDAGYSGTGVTLRACGESIIYAENLNTMLKEGDWKAPFCFFRAIDLAMDRCAIPRIEGLLEEVENLGGLPRA